MKRVELFFDALFEMAGNIALAFIRRLAPFSVPAAPAFFFGHAVYTAVLAMSGNQPAAFSVGGVAAVGLESVGILSAHIAVRLHSGGERGKATVATGIAVFYLLAGIAGIWLLESTSRDAKITGTVMFLIAGAVYLLLGLIDDDGTRRTTQATAVQQAEAQAAAEQRRIEQAEADRLVWQRQQEEVAAQRAHEAHIEQIRLAARVKVEQAQARAAASSQPVRRKTAAEPAKHYECACGRVFEGSRSYNAHRRHCEIPASEPAKVYTNGQGAAV